MTTPAPRKYKAKVNIVVDTETLALDSKAAIVDIGAVVVWVDPTFRPDRFHVLIKPSSYVGTPFEISQETVAWHNQNKPDYLRNCEEHGVSFQECIQSFTDWIMQYKENFEVHMWAQGKDFDQSVLGWLYKMCNINPPYSYRNFHCVRDLLFLNPVSRIKGGQDEAAHTALADAEWAAAQLKAIINGNNWYQRLLA